MQTLTKELRRAVCVHEAGHAIVHALGGNFIYRVAVAPEGATDWQIEGRKGGALTDLWGMCSPSDLSYPFPLAFMTWDENDGAYRTDRAGLTAMLLDMDRQAEAQGIKIRFIKGQRVLLRRHLFGALAGPIAEALYLGEDAQVATSPYIQYEGDDISKAFAYSFLLPWRNEYEHAQELTEKTLLRPDVWEMVMRLADELERVGDIEEGLEAFLPARVPNWPPSPRERQDRPFVVCPLEF